MVRLHVSSCVAMNVGILIAFMLEERYKRKVIPPGRYIRRYA